MEQLAHLLKFKRKALNIRSVDLAKALGIDQALISKYENGKRLPTKNQIKVLAKNLQLSYDELLTLYYKDLMLKYLSYDEISLKALHLVKLELEQVVKPSSKLASRNLKTILARLDKIHARYLKLEISKQEIIRNKAWLDFVYSNCQLNSNSLSKEEIQQINQEGLTIAGKSIKEHFEVMNHYELLEKLSRRKPSDNLNAQNLIALHQQLYKGVQGIHAGEFRKTDQSLMSSLTSLLHEVYQYREKEHAITLAAQFRLRFLALSPFQHSNEAFANLVANCFLVQEAYLPLAFEVSTLEENAYAQALQSYEQNTAFDLAYECFSKVLLHQYQNTLNSI